MQGEGSVDCLLLPLYLGSALALLEFDYIFVKGPIKSGIIVRLC